MLNDFQGFSKLQKTMLKKVKALNCICLVTTLTKILFWLFTFAVMEFPKRVDAPTCKKYVTAQHNYFQMD